jgi:nucleoside-diphosphate-sugar epimerase
MQLRNSRVLVTGAAGFIGSHVARACVREGASVACVFLPGSDAWRLQEAIRSVKRYDVNLEDQEAVKRVYHEFQPEFVLHLAARIDRVRNLDIYESLHAANVLTTLNLVRAALASNYMVRFVHTGTIEEYGRGTVPFHESDREAPVSPYSLTKHESVRIVTYAAQRHGLPAVVLRLPLAYGPLQGKGLFIPDFIRAALTTKVFDMSSGEQTRDFLHVDDIVRAYLAVMAAEGNNLNGEIFNVASGIETKLLDVANRLRDAFDGDVTVNVGARPSDPNVDTMRCFMDAGKIRERLGWSPAIDFADGIVQTAEWYKTSASSYEHLWD